MCERHPDTTSSHEQALRKSCELCQHGIHVTIGLQIRKLNVKEKLHFTSDDIYEGPVILFH